jgi:hypothetical protein
LDQARALQCVRAIGDRLMYRVSWQDYRNFGTVVATKKRPPLSHLDFSTIEAARAERDRLIAEGMTACVTTATSLPKQKTSRRAKAIGL